MSAELITNGIVGLVMLALMWQQNRILRRQNDILAHDADMAAGVELTVGYRRYWPLITMAVLAVVTWAAIGTWISLRHSSTNVTSENVQGSIRNWIDSFGYFDTRTMPPSQLSPLYYWDIEAKEINGNVDHIARVKNHDQYIGVMDEIGFPPEYSQLPQDAKHQIMHLVNIEMDRTNTSFQWNDARNAIHIERRMPISGLTEATFLSGLDQLDGSAGLVRETVGLELDRRGINPLGWPAGK